jgi:hypothetical protein
VRLPSIGKRIVDTIDQSPLDQRVSEGLDIVAQPSSRIY